MNIMKKMPYWLLMVGVFFANHSYAKSPNVVIIMSDDAGYADIGFSGSDLGKSNFSTPNLDALANNGTHFSQGYVTASVCSPSRAGFITGRYQQRFGHEYNLPVSPEPGDDYQYSGLPVGETTLADYFKAAGYQTSLIGKWHLGLAPQFHPNKRGFDEFYGILGGGRSYWDDQKPASRYRQVYRNQQPENYRGYLTDVLTNEAVRQINSTDKKSPFFMFLSHTAVHAPMEAKPELLAKVAHIKDEKRRILAAMTLSLDESMARVISALKAQQLIDNTIVIFINDNGGPSDYNASLNTPLSGVKGTLYEGGVRVPFVISWPGVIPAGKTYPDMVSSLDIMPTLLAAIDYKEPLNKPLDGVNLLPFITADTEQVPHQTLYWRRAAFAAIRHENYKLVRFPDRPAVLYDIKNDRAEQRNLADTKPAIVRDLMTKLFAWETQLSAPLFVTHAKWIKQNRQRYSRYTEIEKQ